MGIKRVVDMSFWKDGKVGDFTPEDKYFMLYLLTNPASTQLGIYEINIRQAAFDLGYSVEAVRLLIDRFVNTYELIYFAPDTNEIAIKNYLQHSIVKGGAPVRDCLIKEMRSVKKKHLIDDVFAHLQAKPTYSELVNATVRKLIADYCANAGDLRYFNEKDDTSTIRQRYGDNDNDNENENDNGNEAKIDIIDKIDKSDKSPFPPSSLTKELIDAGYITLTDLYIDQYNAILQELIDCYSFEIARSCLWYFIKRYKQQPTDEDGKEIENKVAYFRTSMFRGAERLERENNQADSGIGSWLYRK